MQWTGQGQDWVQVGGPAASIIGGGAYLLATAPNTGDLMEYQGSGWTQIGGAGAEFAEGSTSEISGLTPGAKAVTAYSGSGQSWATVGGPANEIVAP